MYKLTAPFSAAPGSRSTWRMRRVSTSPLVQIVSALLLALCFTLHAAENQIVLNIEPNKEHPRSSEGSFVTLTNGSVQFFYTQFQGGANDNSSARIVAISSTDRGRTWNNRPKVVVGTGTNENVMSVSLLRLASGKILMFYLIKNGWLDCHPYVCESINETETWSAPEPVTTAPGYFVLNNDRVIQLQNGQLIVPLAFHRSKSSRANYAAFDARALDLWCLSSDEGKTWREANSWWAMPERSGTGLQEPGVVELSDGSLFSWARTDQGAQFGFRSTDHGRTWSAPEPTSLKSPVSPASIKRIPGSADLLALYNDHSGDFPFPKGKRTPLVAALSSDGGKTWPIRKVVESDPDGWYCYTAIHFVDDAVLLAYCAGDSKVGGLNRLRLRRLSLDWLREK